MTSLTKLRKLAASLGCTVETQRTSESVEVEVVAPHGMMFDRNQLHALLSSQTRPWGTLEACAADLLGYLDGETLRPADEDERYMLGID